MATPNPQLSLERFSLGGAPKLPTKPFPRIPEVIKNRFGPELRRAWDTYEEEVEMWVKSNAASLGRIEV